MTDVGFDLSTVDRLLTTTRSIRRRLDLSRGVEPSVIEECLAIGLQAPSGGNTQRYRWIVVSDPGIRRKLGAIYARAFREYLAMGAGQAADVAIHSGAGSDATKQHSEFLLSQEKMMRSVEFLIDRIHEVPIHVVPCVIGRIQLDASPSWIASHFASIFPAVWNFQLALHSRGLGTCITTAHLGYEAEAAELLGIPFERMTQACLLPVAYVTGSGFKPGPRRPLHEVVYWETFDADSLDASLY